MEICIKIAITCAVCISILVFLIKINSMPDPRTGKLKVEMDKFDIVCVILFLFFIFVLVMDTICMVWLG